MQAVPAPDALEVRVVVRCGWRLVVAGGLLWRFVVVWGSLWQEVHCGWRFVVACSSWRLVDSAALRRMLIWESSLYRSIRALNQNSIKILLELDRRGIGQCHTANDSDSEFQSEFLSLRLLAAHTMPWPPQGTKGFFGAALRRSSQLALS